jgi:uncharacterized membrane protein
MEARTQAAPVPQGSILEKFVLPGRLIFAAAIAAFGVQYFIYAARQTGIGPPWLLARPIPSIVAGAALVVTGAGVVLGKRIPARLLGTALFLFVLIYYLPLSVAAPLDGTVRTRTFEILAMSACAFFISGAMRNRKGNDRVWAIAGRVIFAICLVVFGIDHFLFAQAVQSLVPAWLPGHWFWAYFTGSGFIAAGICIGINKLAPLAAVMTGTMFFLWVVILHAPRVALALQNSNEWTSALVALAMSGAAFVFAHSTEHSQYA